jgi:hypothetical protein
MEEMMTSFADQFIPDEPPKRRGSGQVNLIPRLRYTIETVVVVSADDPDEIHGIQEILEVGRGLGTSRIVKVEILPIDAGEIK